MEERKRPASQDNGDIAPPLKRQATSMNGASKPHPDADMPWQDDLERFQKEALWRQMQELKREKVTLEGQLNASIKRATHHDDHLRAIDAWFSQLLDEVRLIVGQIEYTSAMSTFPSALLSADNTTFEQHLKSRSAEISSAVSQLFARPSQSNPEVSELQGRVAHLLAVEKGHIVELEKSREEKFQLEERLEGASLRYLVAEKKLDRVKSATVAKLERQIAAGGGVFGAESVQGDNDVKMENGDVDVAAVETARKEAVAAACKQKEQLEALEAANEKLTKEVTTLNARLTHFADDDYAKTDLFKHLKSQHEDVIKRINDLEATNVKLREEAEKLQAERTAYRVQVELESQAAVSEKGAQLQQAESDLARIRTARDELVSDVAMRKAAQNQERSSVNQIKELAASKEDRVKALESEVERLGSLLNQPNTLPPTSPNVEAIPLDELRNRYANIERQYSMLKNELQSMGNAYKKASAVANQKVGDLSALEDKTARLVAEKSKADQKYFGAMREKEARDQEFRTSRAQNAKSSEIVSQLKEAEAASRALLVNLEKQLAETKDALSSMTGQHRKSQQEAAERQIKLQGLGAQVDELRKSLGVKDSSISFISSTHRKAEVEIEALKVRLAETEKSVQSWQKKGLGNQSQEYEALRNLTYCGICKANIKDTCIKVCGHLFCQVCVKTRLDNRLRKCPNCNKPFGNTDTMHITL